jgi:hypothetical protein
MSEAIDRAAKAIAPKAWNAYGKVGVDCAAQDNRRKASLRHARAAITSIREPTLEMVKAGCRAALESGELHTIFSAMIDEALK